MSIDKSLPAAPNYLTPVQFALIILPFAFFFDTAVHFRGYIDLSVPTVMIFLTLLNGGVLVFSILAVIRYIAFRKKSMLNTCANQTAWNKRFLSYLPVLVVISIFTVLALCQFDNIPRYDSGLYYDALITKTNSFSFSSLVTSFSLIDHPTQGISFFLASGEMLFLAQTYYNLDPLIAYDNPKILAGNQYIYSPTAPWYTKMFQLSFLNEMYVYNRTYAFTDDLLDCALAKVNLNKSDPILTAGCDYYELYLFRDTSMTGNLIYWDPVNLRRTYDSAAVGAFVPNFLFFKDEDILDGSEIALSDDFYYILPARRTSDYLEAIEKRGYTVKDSFKVENYIGYLNVYHLVRSSQLR